MSILIDSIEKQLNGSVQKGEDHEITGNFLFDRDFIGFSGHFPGYPILPAVIQLFLAQLLIEKQKGYKIKVTSIKKAKFLSEIRPCDEITVNCVDVSSGENTGSRVSIKSGDKQVASFNMSYCLWKESINC